MDRLEPILFEPIPSAVPGEVGFVFRVPGTEIGKFTMPTPRVTTYADFAAPGRLRRGEYHWDDMVFTHNEDGGAGYHAFYFHEARSRAQEAVAIRSETEWLDMTWPDVLTTLAQTDFEAYDSNGDAYVADSVWETDFKIYKGPTRVVTEYFASLRTFGTADAWVTATPYTVGERVLQSGVVYRCLTAHTSGTFATDLAAVKWVNDWALESMQPQPINWWYGVGNLQVRPCLHPYFELTFTTGTPNPRYPYQTFAQNFAATNPTDWPASLRIANGETFQNGQFIRRVATAYKPF